MRSFTNIVIKHPVLAIVVNLVIVLVGWRAVGSLPVQQFPKLESSSVLGTTIYYGASAETVRGFLTTPTITPFSPPSSLRQGYGRQAGPAWAGVTQRSLPQRLFQAPPAESKFLAAAGRRRIGQTK